jgi:hypothetical protein
MPAQRSELFDEEWEALMRISRGVPESRLVPSVLVGILVDGGLAIRRGRSPALSEAGKKLILKHKFDDR